VKCEEKEIAIKMAAANKRFGAMAGVTPQKVQCEIES